MKKPYFQHLNGNLDKQIAVSMGAISICHKEREEACGKNRKEKSYKMILVSLCYES